MKYRETVAATVNEEFERYRAAELTEEPEQIFEDCHRIFFRREVTDFLISDENGLKEKDYKALYEDRGSMLDLLWDFYLSGDSGDITTWEEIKNLIKDYCANSAKSNEAEIE